MADSTRSHSNPVVGPAETCTRVALVTGASSGLGLHIARRLAADGFRTFGASRKPRAGFSAVTGVTLDVRDPDSVQGCVEEVVTRAGHIDVLVNNAGVLATGPDEELSEDAARAVFETNYFGVIAMSRAVLVHMRPRRTGRIIQIGSLAGLLPTPGEATYAASKAAVASHADALRFEVAPLGIAVSVIEPGFHRTGMSVDTTPPQNPIPDYDTLRSALNVSLDHGLRHGSDPAGVAALVSRVVAAPRPRARYRAGQDALWLPRLRRLMPERAFEGGVRRSFGL
ncbi:MAG TPA: SDR family NAD(P)-dependent oxidoreductase [Ornithinimicrobium sp.]|uniref:SDR family NAD(P)-dependent oxidoreductase n=1 Tax=Ornithinimicrobium sp. TaxID=1977084 RepID=UPI002B49D02A|nr:SDR family NAD(P)-dependent oxidoreductase [Ornithinimicrobium sp.]HKJ12487.1 SDR family NAD(P)-dependent oxidoreductase [Ornithinimicrobium sp.]